MKECTDFILFGLKSIDTVTSSPEGLYDENSIFETMIGAPIDFDTQKQNYKDWLIRKGFEELIEGTKRSLSEAYFFIEGVEYVKKQLDEIVLSDLQEKMNSIRKKNFKKDLPKLLEKINKYSTSPLCWENQILTINKARNCIVHRKGIVTKHDINDKEDDNLIIKWAKFEIFYEYKNKEIAKRPIQVKLKNEIKEKSFKLGEKLKFDFKEFNEIVMTCFYFVLDLEEKIQEIEEQYLTRE